MLDQEFWQLVARIQGRGCEEQTTEVKAAARGCPERLYDRAGRTNATSQTSGTDSKRALYRLRHGPQAGEGEGFLPLNELDRRIAVGLDLGAGQKQASAQGLFVVENAVVGQGEGPAVHSAGKGGRCSGRDRGR